MGAGEQHERGNANESENLFSVFGFGSCPSPDWGVLRSVAEARFSAAAYRISTEGAYRLSCGSYNCIGVERLRIDHRRRHRPGFLWSASLGPARPAWVLTTIRLKFLEELAFVIDKCGIIKIDENVRDKSGG